MTDYEKLTVANLRVLLKDRGIPSTGLSRKAQIIAKLQEGDAIATKTADDQDATSVQAEEIPTEQDVVQTPPAVVAPTPKSSSTEVAAKPNEIPTPLEEPTAEEGSTAEAVEPAGPEEANKNVDVPQEEPSPIVQPTQSTRSLSQTPLPSREDPVPQPTPQKSIDSSPALTRENTAATTQTDSEERMKRKRRSGSPSIDTQELAIKRARVAEEVHLKEDAATRPSETVKGDITMSEADAVNAAEAKEQGGKDHGIEGRDMVGIKLPDENADAEDKLPHAVVEELETRSSTTKPNTKQPKDNRYQQLIASEQSKIGIPPVSVNDLPTPPPAIHAATRALYVRNFMRPLQINALRSHILSLTGAEDAEVIEILYVDSVRTHAFIIVKSLAIAARIRAGLHDQTWPEERDRKPLWADYVPVENISKWINAEESSVGGSRPGGRKWEVLYHENEDKTTAQHVEVGANNAAPSGPKAAQGDRRDQPTSQPSESKSATAPAVKQPEAAAESFMTLDKMFKSTRAKPMLYFMPVEIKIVDKRLDEIDDLTSKRWSSRDWKNDDELRRYTFEDDRLVDSGRHNVQRRAADSGRGGASSRYGRGPSRGSYRGSWR